MREIKTIFDGVSLESGIKEEVLDSIVNKVKNFESPDLKVFFEFIPNLSIHCVELDRAPRVMSFSKFITNKKYALAFNFTEQEQGVHEILSYILSKHYGKLRDELRPKFEVTLHTGEEVKKIYKSVYKSCMTNNCATHIYTTNPETVSVVLFKHTETERCARALLFKVKNLSTQKEEYILDRIYPNDYCHMTLIYKHCQEMGWNYRRGQSAGDNAFGSYSLLYRDESYELELNAEEASFPYMDTFHYGYWNRFTKKIYLRNKPFGDRNYYYAFCSPKNIIQNKKATHFSIPKPQTEIRTTKLIAVDVTGKKYDIEINNTLQVFVPRKENQ